MVGGVLFNTDRQTDSWLNIIRLIFAFATAFQTHLSMDFAFTCIGMMCFTVLRG